MSTCIARPPGWYLWFSSISLSNQDQYHYSLQENLVLPVKQPRAARPVSTCLGADFAAAGVVASKSHFNRSRLRASIGGVPSRGGHAPPIATLPPKSTAVKLSDMKNALPSTPLLSRCVRLLFASTPVGRSSLFGTVSASMSPDLASLYSHRPYLNECLERLMRRGYLFNSH